MKNAYRNLWFEIEAVVLAVFRFRSGRRAHQPEALTSALFRGGWVVEQGFSGCGRAAYRAIIALRITGTVPRHSQHLRAPAALIEW